jgi:hypothetical protein
MSLNASISSLGISIGTKDTIKYAPNMDYLVSAVIYLGSSRYWWGRSASRMAHELRNL